MYVWRDGIPPIMCCSWERKKFRNNERNVSQTTTYLELNIEIYFVHSVGFRINTLHCLLQLGAMLIFLLLKTYGQV